MILPRLVLRRMSVRLKSRSNEDLKDLLKQCDRIVPDWCACGICSSNHKDEYTEIYITYDDVWKANESVSCKIKEPNE